MMRLGHIISDEPRVIGCFRSLIIRHPQPGRPNQGWSAPGLCSSGTLQYTIDHPSWSTITLKLFPQLQWSTSVPGDSSFMQCQRTLSAQHRDWPGNALQSTSIHMAHSEPSTHSLCRPLAAQSIWPSVACVYKSVSPTLDLSSLLKLLQLYLRWCVCFIHCVVSGWI